MILFLGIPLLAFILTYIRCRRSKLYDKGSCTMLGILAYILFLILVLIWNGVFTPSGTSDNYYITQQEYKLTPIYEQNYSIVVNDTITFAYENALDKEVKINSSTEPIKIHYTTGKPYAIKRTYRDFKKNIHKWVFVNFRKDTSYWDIYVPTNSVFYIS